VNHVSVDTEVAILGGGIGGLTLALSLHQAGISCRVYEAVPELLPLGVGINILPHAVRELAELGLLGELDSAAVRTRESVFFNQFGQKIFAEPAGIEAGFNWPQFSIHRGDLHMILLNAVKQRLGDDAVLCGHRSVEVTQIDNAVQVHFDDGQGRALPTVKAAIAVGSDGIHSALRRQLYPNDGPPRYSGVNMWRGTTRWKPILTGASMIRAGWLTVGKMVIYPIKTELDSNGLQLINWVAELQTPQPARQDWTRQGRLEDFLPHFESWKFDWLDVPALIAAADSVLEYPMVDKDPLPRWTHGRLTLLGDAAHPMVPRGANGAGQAILDARYLTHSLKEYGLNNAALEAYDQQRVAATNNVILTNRTNPPDSILRVVHERTGGKPFDTLEDIVPVADLRAIADSYRKVAGYEPEQLNARPSLV
jgi:2-polyprenyl-6-methoxyphenol hydroxylase-like FAD-dependent oxidoreductase